MAARLSRRRPYSHGVPSSAFPQPQPYPQRASSALTGPPKPAHHRPKPPASCRRGSPWPPLPCFRGAPTSGLPSSKLSPGIAPRPSPEAHRPLHRLPSPTGALPRRSRPPSAAALRGAANSEHPSPHKGPLQVRLELLSISRNLAPTAGDSARRKRTGRRSSVPGPTRDLQLKETKIPGASLQNVHGLQTANFENS